VAEPTLRVCALYPDLMNIYADRGNLLMLERRCAWRGIGFDLAGAGLGDEVDPDAHDLFYLGGGQDRDQALCAQDLATVKRDALHGVGLVDLKTVREPGERLIGNAAIAVGLEGGPSLLAGFENHGGRTYLGAGEQPLGRILKGHGNNGSDGGEGVRGGPHRTVIGTYLHGPLLPKNAAFADWLTATALGLDPGALAPLDDALEVAAHGAARRAAGI
jgi:CobQ-like glutamine amidotransferase family enzyme